MAAVSIRFLAEALKEAARWAEWDMESLEDFHAYAHMFDGQPGDNVYTFVLRDALRERGLTLQQFRDMYRGQMSR